MRIQICGFYGFGNMGDEAILQSIMQDLRDHEYIISTSLPIHLFQGYKKIIDKELRLHEDLRTDFDAYILGGGELNWGYGWRQSLSIFANNVPCMNYGVAYNTRYYYSEKLHPLYHEFLRHFAAISVRDEHSLRLLETMGLKPVLTFDPAINLKTTAFECPENKIAVFPRYEDYPISNQPQIDWLVNELKDVAGDVVLVPCAPFNTEGLKVDLALCEEIHDRLKGSEILNISPFEPGKFKYFISKSRMVYSGGRYHPLVFAIAHDIPYKFAPTASSYPKIQQISEMYKMYGRDDLIRLANLNKLLMFAANRKPRGEVQKIMKLGTEKTRMKKISCIYATARPSDTMIGRKDECHIKLLLDSLAKQTMGPDEFEVMIADCYYDKRPEQDHITDNTYRGVKYPFTIYHWQVKSPWLKRGLWTYQATWNQGIMLADSELICTFGDCCEPIPEYLERMWNWYQKGYWAMGLVNYKINNKLFLKEDLKTMPSDFMKGTRELIKRNWDPHPAVRDSRWVFVDKSPDGIFIPIGFHSAQSFHGYASLPLEAMLKINGMDENLDGCRPLGDCDTGIRLMHAGYKDKVLLDEDLWLYENRHEDVPKSILTYDGPDIRSNLGLMMLNHELKRSRANSHILTDSEIEQIVKYSVDNDPWAKTYDQTQNPHFQWWRKHQPVFDIVELRKQVQEKLKEGIVEIPEYYD